MAISLLEYNLDEDLVCQFQLRYRQPRLEPHPIHGHHVCPLPNMAPNPLRRRLTSRDGRPSVLTNQDSQDGRGVKYEAGKNGDNFDVYRRLDSFGCRDWSAANSSDRSGAGRACGRVYVF